MMDGESATELGVPRDGDPTSFITLGIETSCDETSAAVLRGETEILSNVVYSQVDLHARYGGVVPEVASRNHVVKLPYIVDEAFERAGVRVGDVSLFAATRGPGLVGPLLVGLCHAKGMAYASRTSVRRRQPPRGTPLRAPTRNS